VHGFCQHPTLQFEWVKWLPQRNAYPWGPFWNGFLDEIDARVRNAKIFRCNTSGQFKEITTLRRLDRNQLDRDGRPVFADLTSELYLSLKYDNKDQDLLISYGLESLSISERIAIVSFDTNQGDELSRLRRRETDDDWYNRAAKLICVCMEDGTEREKEEVRSMKLIPLTTGEWTNVKQGQVFYSHSQGQIEIPDGLGFQLVKSSAEANLERRALFNKLGVRTAPMKLIQDRIFSLTETNYYMAYESCLRLAVSNLQYLYLSDKQGGNVLEPALFHQYPVYNNSLKILKAHRTVIYSKTDNEYGPFAVLGPKFRQTWFLHDAYLEKPPISPPGRRESWEYWLNSKLNIQPCLRLTTQASSVTIRVLSPELRHVSSNCPENVVGVLQRSWASQRHIFLKNLYLLKAIREIAVPCTQGEKVPLEATYLALPELRESFSRYAAGETFPFLQLPESIESGNYQRKWGFLTEDLGVGYREEHSFYLRVLEVLAIQSGHNRLSEREGGFLELYRAIRGSCLTYKKPGEAHEAV
jgi:hypothetical protein